MNKVRYSAKFVLPDGQQFTLTRASTQDYGYTAAWLLVEDGNKVISKGFSRDRQLAESVARPGVRDGRFALYAEVSASPFGGWK